MGTGRDDQKMREINPAGVSATSNIDTNILKSAPITVNGKVVTNVPTAALLGVKIGMAAFFKIKDSNGQGNFVSVGRVTAVGSATFTLDTTIPAAYATSAWIANDGGAGPTDYCTTTNCQIRFNTQLKAELMDEREVEIGDRIRILTSLGSWETRTVDSVTYTSGFQVSGFVVSEPYENTVSTTQAIASSTINNAGAIDKDTTTCAVGDFCKITGTTFTGSDGVYQIAATGSGTTTFSPTFGKPGEQTSQTITFTKTHLAYNDGAGTTEAKSCSGRGLCDDSSGECQCFKGYTGVDCSIKMHWLYKKTIDFIHKFIL